MPVDQTIRLRTSRAAAAVGSTTDSRASSRRRWWYSRSRSFAGCQVDLEHPVQRGYDDPPPAPSRAWRSSSGTQRVQRVQRQCRCRWTGWTRSRVERQSTGAGSGAVPRSAPCVAATASRSPAWLASRLRHRQRQQPSSAGRRPRSPAATVTVTATPETTRDDAGHDTSRPADTGSPDPSRAPVDLSRYDLPGFDHPPAGQRSAASSSTLPGRDPCAGDRLADELRARRGRPADCDFDWGRLRRTLSARRAAAR